VAKLTGRLLSKPSPRLTRPKRKPTWTWSGYKRVLAAVLARERQGRPPRRGEWTRQDVQRIWTYLNSIGGST